MERRGRKARCRFELGRQERCGAAPVRPARQQHGSRGAGSARGQPPGCGSCSRPAAHPAALGRGPGGPSLTAVHGDHKWRGPGEHQSLGRTALSMLCRATPALGFHRPPGAQAQLPRHSTSREHSSRRPQAPQQPRAATTLPAPPPAPRPHHDHTCISHLGGCKRGPAAQQQQVRPHPCPSDAPAPTVPLPPAAAP